MTKCIQSLMLAIALALLSACGGSGGVTEATAPVIPAPVITAQPGSTTVFETFTATFTVVATDSGTMTYQWKKNGIAVAGANSNTLVLAAVHLSDNAAVMTVEVTGSGGTTVSVAAILTVETIAPHATTPPTPQSVVAGQIAHFSVTAAGLPPFTYQWHKNGHPISGATAASYATPVTLGDHGAQYAVAISNSAGYYYSELATLTVQASNLSNLVISEVATCPVNTYDCWFEIYNPTSAPINLGAYTLKSSSIHVTTGVVSTKTFVLPDTAIASDGYVVISGTSVEVVQRGNQNIRLLSDNMVPHWSGSGFIELLQDGSTVDFVVFGGWAQVPTTANQWSGQAVPALAYSDTDYGKSMVRLFPRTVDTNTHSAADWVAVDWATPAGRNDVPVGAQDADGDGIADSAEVAGGTYAGLDLYAMGARVGQKDIFIEVDYMFSGDLGIIPRKEALQKVVASFAAKGIHLAFDAGTAFSANFSESNFNLGQGANVVPYEKCTSLNQSTCSQNLSSRRSLYDWKDEHMDLRRRSVFHYLLFGNSQLADGSSGGPGGVAEQIGNDFLVTMGNWSYGDAYGVPLNLLINWQASTVMHELGHNLGLRHGGNEETNYKPNYWSIMNYMYQSYGLDPDPSASTAYQRWRLIMGDATPPTCSLVGSPCGAVSQFVMSFSDGSSTPLDEASLMESSNIGRGSNASAYADWSLDGMLNTSALARDINGDGSLSVLNDHNDWGHLVFPFARQHAGNTGIDLSQKLARHLRQFSPILADRQEVASEQPASSTSILKLLREAKVVH